MSRSETASVGAFALGQVVLGALSLTGLAMVLAQVLLVGILLAPAIRRWRRVLPAFALAFGGLLGVVGAARTGGATTAETALVLVVAGTVLVYGVHRYELVALGLVRE